MLRKGLSALRQGRLGSRRERRECRRIIGCNFRQHLAIEFYSGLLQSVDELAVADSVQLSGGVDAYDPDGTVLALLLLATRVSELESALDALFR